MERVEARQSSPAANDDDLAGRNSHKIGVQHRNPRPVAQAEHERLRRLVQAFSNQLTIHGILSQGRRQIAKPPLARRQNSRPRTAIQPITPGFSGAGRIRALPLERRLQAAAKCRPAVPATPRMRWIVNEAKNENETNH
jgi:hypothetical protein